MLFFGAPFLESYYKHLVLKDPMILCQGFKTKSFASDALRSLGMNLGILCVGHMKTRRTSGSGFMAHKIVRGPMLRRGRGREFGSGKEGLKSC